MNSFRQGSGEQVCRRWGRQLMGVSIFSSLNLYFAGKNSTMSDMFAVLHVDTCGDVVEQVSEVTSSHIKLLQPNFSPIGGIILMKLGFPVYYDYEVLIYKTKKEFLTLDIYVVPPDHALQQVSISFVTVIYSNNDKM